jgi:hypothetical protein
VIPRRVRLAITVLLAAAAVPLAGCDPFAWILVKTIGPFVPEETAKAEYDLKGRSLLVLVDVKDPAVASDFPRLETELSDAISKALADKQACGPTVPGRNLDSARRAEPKFGEWSVVEVGKYFNVDLVMHVEVVEFRLKDDPASNVYHGYAETAVRLVSPQTGEQTWPVLSPARLVAAETQPDVDVQERGEQESVLVDGYAEKLARLFYTYKTEDLPMRPKVK